MQKLSKREVEIITQLLKFKLKTESPFNLKLIQEDKLKKQIIEFFFDDVLTDIVDRKYPLEMSEDSLLTLIKKIGGEPFMNISDVFRSIPEYGYQNSVNKKPDESVETPPVEETTKPV